MNSSWKAKNSHQNLTLELYNFSSFLCWWLSAAYTTTSIHTTTTGCNFGKIWSVFCVQRNMCVSCLPRIFCIWSELCMPMDSKKYSRYTFLAKWHLQILKQAMTLLLSIDNTTSFTCTDKPKSMLMFISMFFQIFLSSDSSIQLRRMVKESKPK